MFFKKKEKIVMRTEDLKEFYSSTEVNLGSMIKGLDEEIKMFEHNYNKYLEKEVKHRYLSENQVPNLKYGLSKEETFAVLELEFKRFLFLCSIVKELPMASEDVDELWHCSLMFTKNYYNFCYETVGHKDFIHHVPNMGEIEETSEKDDNQREFFNFIYCTVFKITPFTEDIWSEMFQHCLSGEITKELIKIRNTGEMKNKCVEFYGKTKEDEFREKYFRNPYSNSALVTTKSIRKISQKSFELVSNYKKQEAGNKRTSTPTTEEQNDLLNRIIAYSWIYNYPEEVEAELNKNNDLRGSSASSSSQYISIKEDSESTFGGNKNSDYIVCGSSSDNSNYSSPSCSSSSCSSSSSSCSSSSSSCSSSSCSSS